MGLWRVVVNMAGLQDSGFFIFVDSHILLVDISCYRCN